MGRFATAVIAAALGVAVCALAFTTNLWGLGPVTGGSASPTKKVAPAVDYPGDGVAEAKVVAREERRIIQVRAVSNAAQLTGLSTHQPYRLAVGDGYTLVLVKRSDPYTVAELLPVAPRTFTTQPDGSLLLNENIVVEQGATLQLSGVPKILMKSGAGGFASIVTIGGSLEMHGTKNRPLEVQSFDPSSGAVDENTADGRAYIRVMGGHADILYTDITGLGFWSGVTGGLSLTGTTVPDVGSTALAPESDKDPEGGPPTLYGQQLLDATGGTAADTGEPSLAELGDVSARIRDVQIRGNAYGLFVSSADGVQVSDSSVSGSLVDGIVFHRDVTDSSIATTTVQNSGGDGIAILRATTKILVSRVTVSHNALNGITLDGTSVADGPSAAGFSTIAYGRNQVRDSSSVDNGHYGIQVTGGSDVSIVSNDVTGHAVGIVVDTGARKVTLKDNLVEKATRQGVVLRDAGTDATVSENTISGGPVAIYARNAGGTFERNRIRSVTNHGITLIGATGSSSITGNRIAGSGPTAIDTARSDADVTTENNLTSGWTSTKPLDVVLRSIFQPLTVLWIVLALIVIFSALAGIGRRRDRIVDPFTEHAPLAAFSRGIVSPAEARSLASARTDAARANRVPIGPELPALPPVPSELDEDLETTRERPTVGSAV